MDRHLPALESAPRFTWRRLAVTVLASAAILGAGSYLVRAYPNSGYDAGYEAVMTEGTAAVHGFVNAAGGTSRPLCDELHTKIDQQPDQPHYDHDTFIEGCSAAVDELYGGQVSPARNAG